MHKHSNLEEKLQIVSQELANTLDGILPKAQNGPEDQLFRAMRYSSLSFGKRIRPFLAIHTSKLFGVNNNCALNAAAAIELIHSYSLVHDDLPALDNDNLRRGIPTCHKQFDEATAILAGDAMLTLAFEVLANPDTHQDAAVRIELIAATARAAGGGGMVGGQMIDLLSEHKNLTTTEIMRLQRMKTGALFAISCETGAILGKAAANLRTALRAYGYNIGLIFQITDDLLDASGTCEQTGKAVRKDEQAGKATLVASWGIEKCHTYVQQLAQQAIEFLTPFDERADILRELVYFLIKRTN